MPVLLDARLMRFHPNLHTSWSDSSDDASRYIARSHDNMWEMNYVHRQQGTVTKPVLEQNTARVYKTLLGVEKTSDAYKMFAENRVDTADITPERQIELFQEYSHKLALAQQRPLSEAHIVKRFNALPTDQKLMVLAS